MIWIYSADNTLLKIEMHPYCPHTTQQQHKKKEEEAILFSSRQVCTSQASPAISAMRDERMTSAEVSVLGRPSNFFNQNTAPLSPRQDFTKVDDSVVRISMDEKSIGNECHHDDDATRIDKDQDSSRRTMRVSNHCGKRKCDDDDATRDTCSNLEDAIAMGKNYQNQGHNAEALIIYRRALQERKRNLDTESKDVQSIVGDILYEIGTIHSQSEDGDLQQSLEAFDFCLEVRHMCYGSSHPAIAIVLYQLAAIHSAADDPDHALHHLLEALAIVLSETPDDTMMLSKIWNAIGNVQNDLGNTVDARSAFEESSRLKTLPVV